MTFNSSALVPGWIYCTALADEQIPPSTVSVLTSDYVSPYFKANRAVTVAIKQLDGARKYSLYCAAQGADGAVSLLADTIASVLNVTTPCCRSMTFDVYRQPQFIFNNRSLYSQNILKLKPYYVTLSSLPDTNVTLSPVLYDSQGAQFTSKDVTFRPSNISFSSDSPSATQSFVVDCSNTSLTGEFTIAFNVSGGDAELYPTTNASLQLVHYSAPSIPAVTINRAIFADSGLSVYIVFSAETNQTLEMNATWPCSNLFVFRAANSTTCSWLNSTAVRALFELDPTYGALRPGRSILVLPNKLLPHCSAYLGIDCSQLQINSISSVVTQLPSHSIKPVPILLIMPIVPCAPFQIDGTLSIGKGGRPLKATRFDVSANVVATSAIAAMKRLLARTPSPVDGPVSYPSTSAALVAGTYYISMTLTNFLGETRTDHAIMNYGGVSTYTPFAGILGSSVRTITRDQVVNFYGRGVGQNCGSPSSVPLNFSYFVQADGSTSNYSVNNVANKPKYFTAPAFSFVPDSYYRVTMQVLAFSTPIATSSYSNIVKISCGQVYAIIKGGSQRQISSDISLDGSSSRDQYQQSSGIGLSFSWYCRIASIENYGSDCDFIFTSSRSSSIIDISYSMLNISKNYEVGLFVNSNVDSRGAYSTIMITPLAEQSVKVEMLTLLSFANADNNAVINAKIEAPNTVYAVWSASVGQEYFSLDNANTPAGRYFNASVAQNTIAFPLSISAWIFPYRSTVSFQLSVMDRMNGNLLGSSAISVTINSPPYGGGLRIGPQVAFAFTTNFPVSAYGWSDESQLTLPLSYDFRFRSSPYSSFYLLQEKSYVNTLITFLPPGDVYNSYKAQMSLRAYNDLGAYSEVINTKTVVPISNVNITRFLINRISTGNRVQDIDFGFGGAAAAAVYLNTINCSAVAASYCASLNRANCYNTPLTCGSCLSGFTGVVGDANTLCFAKGEGSPVGGSCSTNSDCLYGKCESSKCVEPFKTCPSYDPSSTCSGHGACTYTMNLKAVNESKCGIFNAYCSAACVCSNGYTGKACNMDANETADTLTAYSLICGAIEAKTGSPQTMAQFVDGAVALLYQVSIGLAGLNAFDRCRGALRSVVTLVADGGLAGTQPDTVSNLVSIISNLVQPGESAYLTDQLSLIVQGIIQTRVDGQYPAEYKSDFLQVKTYTSLAFDFANQSFQAPRSSQSFAYNASVPSITFVNKGGEYCDTGDGEHFEFFFKLSL